MTIKNKKTKQSKSTAATSSSASTSVQKSSTSSSVQSTSTVQKVSSGKKIRYIDVKVEEDDPLMITDVTDHGSISGSTISEHYNSHPHYIITEAPSINDLSQVRSHEHNVSDMAQSNTGEFVSNSVVQESTSHQQNSKNETFQSSSTSVQHSGASHSQSFDRTADSSAPNQTLNTGFIDKSSGDVPGSSGTTFTTRSHNANASNNFLQTEKQNLVSQNQTGYSTNARDSKNVKQRENVTYRNSPDPSQRNQTVQSNTSNFYGGEGSLDKNPRTKEFTSTSQTSDSKSSHLTKSSSSSYVVEIVDGKERIIDSSNREWGDAQEHSNKEAYASISGTGIKPQSVHSIHNRDMQSNYDTGKDGQKPTSGMVLKEDSKLLRDGKEINKHSNVITEKDDARHQQYIREQLPSSDDQRHSRITSDNVNQRQNIQDQLTTGTDQVYSQYISDNTNVNQSNRSNIENVTTSQETVTDQRHNVNQTDSYENVSTNKQLVQDRRRNVNQTDSSNFYGYDSTIQNELKKVGDILQVKNVDNVNYSTKIMKSNTSSAEQATTSSYVVQIVDGKEVIVDSSHREWGDSKEHATQEKSHNIGGTGTKPQHEYSRRVLDKESHYDTGKKGQQPTSGTLISEESALYKDGKEIASTSNTYIGDFTKKKAITEHITDTDDIHNKRIQDITDQDVRSTTYQSTSTDTKSTTRDTKDVTKTTEFINTEKQNSTKETTDSQTKDTSTTYERSTGAWNGKFTYETDDDRPKRPKEMSPFGKPEQPRHHLKRQDTQENIILSSRDISDFTSISDLRKIIETSQYKKDVKVSNKNIVINRNIDDRILKEIIDTVKKYPFKRIEKVTYGTKINEDVKDLYEGTDGEETTILTSSTGETTRKAFEVDKKRSQVEVTRYVTKNGITRKITTYEDAKEDDKIKTDVFVDRSAVDFKNLVSAYYLQCKMN